MLVPESRELQSVTVTADRINENVVSQITGIEKMSIATIKSVPTFLGEVDPIRSLTTLPGVTTTELSSGFIVRGGESGQNCILQHEVRELESISPFWSFSGHYTPAW